MRGLYGLAAGVALCIAGTVPVDADVYLKQKHHADSGVVMGQRMPAVDRVSDVWFSKDMARINQTPDTAILFRFDRNEMYVISRKARSCMVMPLEDIQAAMSKAMERQGMTAAQKQQAEAMMQQMAAMMKPAFSVKETAEKKKIRSWNCRKYLLTTTIQGMTINSTIWASDEIKVDYAFYNRLVNVYMAKLPGMSDAMKEIDKIKGFMVMMTTSGTVAGSSVKSEEELLEIQEKAPPPPEGYEIPAGYKKREAYPSK